jgi:cell division protein FtsX
MVIKNLSRIWGYVVLALLVMLALLVIGQI